jgi:hypothetical protein
MRDLSSKELTRTRAARGFSLSAYVLVILIFSSDVEILAELLRSDSVFLKLGVPAPDHSTSAPGGVRQRPKRTIFGIVEVFILGPTVFERGRCLENAVGRNSADINAIRHFQGGSVFAVLYLDPPDVPLGNKKLRWMAGYG